jgi:hypothetical protein
LEITLARITPHTRGASARDIAKKKKKKTAMIESASNNTGGHEMIKDAQTKLGGMKKKSKGYKRIELLTKIADMMMLNQVK